MNVNFARTNGSVLFYIIEINDHGYSLYIINVKFHISFSVLFSFIIGGIRGPSGSAPDCWSTGRAIDPA